MKIRPVDRRKLAWFLKGFYERYPSEKYTIFHVVRYFKQRLKLNKDAWMGICGETGVGKSYFALISMILFGRPMDLQKNVSYIPQGDEIIKKFQDLNFQTFLIDEAAKEMRSVNWQSKAQQGVNVAAMTERFRNNWVLLNMPNFNEFTKSMRQTNLLFRAVVLFRTEKYARIVIQRKTRNWRSDDPWYDKEANDVYEKLIKRHGELNNDRILDVERNLSNTVMDFIVPDLQLILPHVTEEYERLKMESRKPIVEQELQGGAKKNPYREKYESVLNRVTKILVNNELELGEGKRVSREAMCKALGISQSSFLKYYKMDRENAPVPPKFRRADLSGEGVVN